METSGTTPVSVIEVASDNGLHEQVTASVDDVVSEDHIEELDEQMGSMKFNEIEESDSVVAMVAEVPVQPDKINVRANKEHGIKQLDASKNPRIMKNVPKNSKPGMTVVKKTKDLKASLAPAGNSNGKIKPAVPLGSKSKSFNERQGSDCKPKLTAVTNNGDCFEQSGQSDVGKSTSVKHSEGSLVKTKLRPLKKDTPNNVEAESQQSNSPTEDGKPRRLGALPQYNFSFKCDERAERRREFYTKLEEKINAKEQEKSSLQAKSKESQEAELRRIRKTLAFKATPMPSFYQEPPPPKVELKKIPTTRAKSPKLGRNKNLLARDSDESSDHGAHPIRLSLDIKVAQNTPAKEPSPSHVKKPVRRSLPKLPSEKTNLSTDLRKAPSLRTTLTKEPSESTLQNLNKGQIDAASPDINMSEIQQESDEATGQEPEQTSVVHQPIAV